MKNPSRQEVAELVEFGRGGDGWLYVAAVKGSVEGTVFGNVYGDVDGSVLGHIEGTVEGTISGREWELVQTPKEKAIRLIREGKGEEAIKVLEESE